MGFKYFSNLPIVEYPLDSNGKKKARDILHRIYVDQKFIDSSDYIRKYQVKEGDRTEIISDKLYERSDIYAIIMLMNNFDTTMLSGLPPSGKIYDQYVENKYSDNVYYLVPTKRDLFATGTGLSGGYMFPMLGYGFSVGERVFGAGADGFQNYNTRAYVKEWNPVMCTLKLDVLSGQFEPGLTLANSNGDIHYKITMKKQGKYAVHHFETVKGTTNGTPVFAKQKIDPLSRIYVSSGAAYHIPLGEYKAGVTASYGTSVVYTYNLTGAVLPSTAPYIRPVENWEYEERIQESKRTINVPATEKSLLGEVINRFTQLLESTRNIGA